MLELDIVKYDNNYKEELINFLSFIWSSLDYENRKNIFEWRYENNPYTKDPFIYLALDGNKIIGHRAFVVQKFTLKDKNYLIASPADAVIHPDYRRRGLFTKLTEFAYKDISNNSNISLIASLSANNASESGNMKFGFIPIGKREYCYCISLWNTIKNNFQTVNLDNPITNYEKNNKIELSKNLKLTEILNLREKNREKTKIKNTKDEVFYKWRFLDSPPEYIYAYYTRNGNLVAYLAIERRNKVLYDLIEYGYSKPTDLEYLLKNSIKKLTIPIIRSYLFTKPKKDITIFNNSGFLNEKSFLMKILKKTNLLTIENGAGMLIKPISKNIIDKDFFFDNKDLRDPSNWLIFQSDIH